ncbi:MAG: nicotinate-nucleotide--dimethylbenzimidazole phosphoribosyltransferase [Flavobacteriaceae bacterium]|nr:MAG: nicotinate-nucleotide--dimethylbenzimidazole phosphoribosyltransferase [Flavobacteriaceae bacterium]
MIQHTINPVDTEIQQALQHKIDFKTKPQGSLGTLEGIAAQIGCIQQSLSPSINKPTMCVFAGDHGIATTGLVSQYPQEVTAQMVLNFLQGGAAINAFCAQSNMDLKVVDAGVNFEFPESDQLIDAKIARGTQNYYEVPAMSSEQLKVAFLKGSDIVATIQENGSNFICFGEMGISNTSSAALIMSSILNIPVADCAGKGTGQNDAGMLKKITALENVQKTHGTLNSPEAILATYGGFEIAMISAAMLEAASRKMVILVDGFIVTSALLVAQAMNKNVLDYCLFAHSSNEQGHQRMLEFLNAKPILNLGLRLGEGTGAALALPIIQASVNFLNQMASFEEAGVSNKE